MQIFRKMTDGDIERVAELEKVIFPDAWTSKSIGETSCQPHAFIVVAEVEGEIAGYCIVYHVLEEGEIARIAVDDRYRRQGLGKGLLDHTCQCCREKQVERLLLDVRESNEAARVFYEKYGFAEDGIRKNFYDTPKEHAVLMSMKIG